MRKEKKTFNVGDDVYHIGTGEVGKVTDVVWDDQFNWYDYYVDFGNNSILRYFDTSLEIYDETNELQEQN